MSTAAMEKLIRDLSREHDLPDEALLTLIGREHDDYSRAPDFLDELLFAEADRVRRETYGDGVYFRGLIEFTNYCAGNCYYCGIRAENRNLCRYRLDREAILRCCREGRRLGFRTFVLQGGEDPFYGGGPSPGEKGDDRLCAIVSQIRAEFPDCAITLSCGERSRDSYQRLFDAGADRYLLRHEAADEDLYRSLHPASMDPVNRWRCLFDLKVIGYQVGAGFMVGPPGQRSEHLLADLRFMQRLQPDMIGIGPYLHHRDTPFRDCPDGSLILTLRMVAISRLMFPWALLPSTTALGTLDPRGRILGLQAGANVVMPNLSPPEVRDQYAIYEGKLNTGRESAAGLAALKEQVEEAGYRLVSHIGNVRREPEEGAQPAPAQIHMSEGNAPGREHL